MRFDRSHSRITPIFRKFWFDIAGILEKETGDLDLTGLDIDLSTHKRPGIGNRRIVVR